MQEERGLRPRSLEMYHITVTKTMINWHTVVYVLIEARVDTIWKTADKAQTIPFCPVPLWIIILMKHLKKSCPSIHLLGYQVGHANDLPL
jgi:hypothetical protein